MFRQHILAILCWTYLSIYYLSNFKSSIKYCIISFCDDKFLQYRQFFRFFSCKKTAFNIVWCWLEICSDAASVCLHTTQHNTLAYGICLLLCLCTFYCFIVTIFHNTSTNAKLFWKFWKSFCTVLKLILNLCCATIIKSVL